MIPLRYVFPSGGLKVKMVLTREERSSDLWSVGLRPGSFLLFRARRGRRPLPLTETPLLCDIAGGFQQPWQSQGIDITWIVPVSVERGDVRW